MASIIVAVYRNICCVVMAICTCTVDCRIHSTCSELRRTTTRRCYARRTLNDSLTQRYAFFVHSLICDAVSHNAQRHKLMN